MKEEGEPCCEVEFVTFRYLFAYIIKKKKRTPYSNKFSVGPESGNAHNRLRSW